MHASQVFSSLGNITTTAIAFTLFKNMKNHGSQSTRNQKVVISFSKVLTACL